MKDILSKIINELKISLKEVDPGNRIILAVYLFGSNVDLGAGSDSDLDLAFLLNEKSYRNDPLSTVVPAYLAATSLAMSLGRETDVTILNSASLEIAYEVVSMGRCLLENETDKRMEYEIALRGMYFDFKPFLEELRFNCISNL